ncbi:MAG: Efflux ABC transporter, permease protein, partial [uncultured Thermomicrobiales bacterium]
DADTDRDGGEAPPLDHGADRRLGVRPAELLPDQTVFLVGVGLAGLHHRQHAQHRLYRPRGRHRAGPGGGGPPDHLPPDRGAPLELPLDAVRHPGRDGDVGTVGGDDRVHLHVSRQPGDAPDRDQHLRGGLRHPADGRDARGDLAVLRPEPGGCQLPGRAGDPGDRQCLTGRVRDGGVGDAAALAGEGGPGDLHLRLVPAADLRRLLPGRRPAGVDAGPGSVLPGLLRVARHPGRARGRRQLRQPVAQRLAAAADRPGLGPGRDQDLRGGGALREADRPPEAERI